MSHSHSSGSGNVSHESSGSPMSKKSEGSGSGSGHSGKGGSDNLTHSPHNVKSPAGSSGHSGHSGKVGSNNSTHSPHNATLPGGGHTNETHAPTHHTWSPPKVPGPSDHAINYKVGGGNANHDHHEHKAEGQIRRHHSDSGQNQHQNLTEFQLLSIQEFSCENDDGESRNLYCCKPSNSVACSSDPNCHLLKSACSPLSLDSFPNPFRPPKRRLPAWLGHCGKVLRFYAFYQESVPESMIENYRIHQCEIRFYLDDGTMDVFEPKTFDPGFLQGRIIRRHKIPMPAPAHNTIYTLDDLNVGCEVQFYGKTFFITGVDDMTRVYLNRKEGRQVVENMEMPKDLYTQWRQDRSTSLFARRANINLDQDKFKKFLANNGKVLRFWAYWDNRCEYGGLLRQYLFHYYLADDTVEIKEIVDPKGGIRGATTFLGKGKLLKNHKDLVPIVGIREEALLILNTTSGGNCKCEIAPSYMTDRLCPGIDEKEYVTDKDLAIGAVVNVYGRAFILVECDIATQTYYREKYGIEDFTPLELEKGERERELPRMEVPPHIGIGDEVDTLYNWEKLEPTEPPRDPMSFLIGDDEILCFEARFYNPIHKVNSARRFIIKVFMVDNTMQIGEKPHPNTGFKKGQFLARSKVRRRGSGLPPHFELGEESEYYVTSDYFIGNVLDVNGFSFLLNGASEMTLSYMEANKHFFPQSDFCLVIDKVKEAFGPLEGEYVLQMFSCKDSQLNGIMHVEDFRSILIALTKEGLNEHEIKTLTRGLRVDAPKAPVDFRTLQSVIQTELQRYSFDHFLLARVEYTLRYHDPCRFGHVDKETLRATLKGARLPLDRLLVDFLIDHFTCVDDCNRINYCSLLLYMDWVHNPVPKASPAHISCIFKWLEPSPPNKNVICINYGAFLDLVNPNFRCDLPSICCSTYEPCEPEPFPRDCPCDDDNSFAQQRERAGYVINDLRVRSEEYRCQDEDVGELCYEDGLHWRNNPRMSRVLVDAYLPPCQPQHEDCVNHLGEGNREVYNPGDFIGFEDMYTRPPPPN